VDSNSTCPFSGRELRSNERRLGTGSARLKTAKGLENYDDKLSGKFHQERNHYSCATAMQEYSARGRPYFKGQLTARAVG
jgi:hypothetical protein